MFWEKLNQNRICVFLVLTVCILVGTIYSLKYTPKECLSSSTVMLIKTKNENENLGGMELSKNLISTFEEVAKSELTIAEVKSNLKLDIENNKLNDKIELDRVSSSDTFNIEVRDASPEMALNINAEVINVFSTRIKDMYGDTDVYIVDAPHVLREVYSKPIMMFVLLSAVIGLTISTIYILALIKIEKNIKSVVDVEIDMFLKTLAQIPLKKYSKKEDKSLKTELLINEGEKSEHRKAFNALRKNIQFLSVNNSKQNKVILITSSVKGEGKSYIAANMAVGFAEIGKKVLLLDADMNTGRQSEIFNVPNDLGLSNYLSNLDANGVELNEFLNTFVKETAIKNLNLITAGTIPPNSSELLTSSRLENLIKDLKVFYDVVIIDGTAILASTDSLVLTRLVGATIIVSNYRKTKKEDLLRTKRDIQNVGGRVIGVILNRTKMPKKKKTKAERKEDFARFRLKVKDTVKNLQNFIKDKIINSKQKLLEESNEVKNIVENNETVERKAEVKEDNNTNTVNEKKFFEKITEKASEIKNNFIQKDDSEKDLPNVKEKITNVISNMFSNKVIENETTEVAEAEEPENEILEEFKEEVKEGIEEAKEEITDKTKNISEKYKEAKKIIVEKVKNIKETLVEKYNSYKEKKNVEIQRIEQEEKLAEEKKVEAKTITENVEIVEEKDNENRVLVIVDAENAYCRVFSKHCFTEKLIRGIDKADGFQKAHYSNKIQKRKQNKLINGYNLSKEQVKRVDPLIYTTLLEYDESMWLDNKLPSNKAEQYALAMAATYERNENETDKEYMTRCQRLRKEALSKADLDIEYKLDGIWKTTRISICDKLVLKKYANLFDVDNKLKSDKEILKSKKNKKFYSDIIKAAETKLKNAESKEQEKKALEQERILEDQMIKQEELKVEEMQIREEQERLRLEKKAEQERIREEKRQEKELRRQERIEENKKKRLEKQKQKEEQRMQKEYEKEKLREEAKIEEELLVDNLYPKTKHNKSL